MNPQYGGQTLPPFGTPAPHGIPYSQSQPIENYNGYEPHHTPGPMPHPTIPNKGFTHTTYMTGDSAHQSGPPPRPMNSVGAGMPIYNQNFAPSIHPTAGPLPGFNNAPGPGPGFNNAPGPGPGFNNAPGSTPSFNTAPGPAPVFANAPGPTPGLSSVQGPDQLAQRVKDMHMSQNQNNPPLPGAVPSQRLMRPSAETFPPSQPDMTRPAYQQPPSFHGSVPGQYRLPNQGPPNSYSSGDVPSISMSGSTYATDSGMRYSGNVRNATPTPPPPQQSLSSRPYSSQPIGPPIGGASSNSMSNDIPQNMGNGYYPRSDPSSGMMPPAYNNANGPMMPPTTPQYQAQPSMQSRYPPMSQSQNAGQGPPGQYPQPGVANSQNRIGTPQPAPTSGPNSRRLDPDHMPSPIQVIEDDRKLHSSGFVTNTRGEVPPLVTTNFVVADGGVCSPRYMRSTIYNVPTTADLLKQTSVPFALTISPFAQLQKGEQPPPISGGVDIGPVRCNRCKAYMCPFMQFIDGGRRFQCVFCKATTEVPPEYFGHLDHMGERVDKFQRPELCLGSYEFVATKEYCKNGNFPNQPAFIFVIDVSYNSIRNGIVSLLCENVKLILSKLPRETEEEPSHIKVGFITYSNVVHFYNVKSNLAQPQMMVVSDVQEMFMPLLDGFLVELPEAEQIIYSLVQQIPVMFADTRETETVLGPAIQAGLEALKAADCSGKLFVFHTTLPIAEAPGKLKNRDDRKLLGTEKEKTVLTPQTTFYNNLGQECVAAGCCVDMFLFPNAYIDISTLGQVSRLTGGQVYKYTFFQPDIDGPRFLEDLKRDVAKPIAFDAIIRVRTSTGIRPTEFWGNFFMSNTTDIEVAAIDCDKAIAVEIKYDDKLGEDDGAYIQTAVLFTSSGGQRRLRIHNLGLNTCSQMAELFRSCELDTIMNVFSKESIQMITEQTPRQVKDHFVLRSAQILACYRKHCANRSSAGQLILPECMKLLPLYINCLIKCDAIAGGQEIPTDDRSFVMLAVNSMNVDSSACYLYPRLIALHDVNPDSEEIPMGIRCSVEKIKDIGVYLIENGLSMFLWIGMAVSPEWIQDVFGVQAVARIDIDKTQLLELNTPLSKRVRDIVRRIQEERQRHMKLIIIRQSDKLEMLFRQLLVEDRTTEGSASYVDFLCHLHKEIRTLLT